MAQLPKPDVLADLDAILAAADTDSPPWRKPEGTQDETARAYMPDYATLRDLLAIPISKGSSAIQQSGRVAKSLDAYLAHELRRAGFSYQEVFPRARQPRVLPAEFSLVERDIETLLATLAEIEVDGNRLKPAKLRSAITRLTHSLPGSADANILGRFYTKQVDVVVADWRRGPDVLISGKSMFSSYLNNKNNRYEEGIGEAHNLRDRYPLAAMGYAYLVRDNVFEGGAFELLRDLLARLRKPDGPFDATVMLVASWDDDTLELKVVEDPAEQLSLPRFFEDLLNAMMGYTPVDIHGAVRARKLGEPTGGFPPDANSMGPID